MNGFYAFSFVSLTHQKWHPFQERSFTRICWNTESEYRKASDLHKNRTGFTHKSGQVSFIVCVCCLVDVQIGFVSLARAAEVSIESSGDVLLDIGRVAECLQQKQAGEDAGTCCQRKSMVAAVPHGVLPMVGCTVSATGTSSV